MSRARLHLISLPGTLSLRLDKYTEDTSNEQTQPARAESSGEFCHSVAVIESTPSSTALLLSKDTCTYRHSVAAAVFRLPGSESYHCTLTNHSHFFFFHGALCPHRQS